MGGRNCLLPSLREERFARRAGSARLAGRKHDLTAVTETQTRIPRLGPQILQRRFQRECLPFAHEKTHGLENVVFRKQSCAAFVDIDIESDEKPQTPKTDQRNKDERPDGRPWG